MTNRISKLLLALVLAIPGFALAESGFTTGGAGIAANARLDFRVIIPRIVYLRVGDSNAFPNPGGAIDRVDFSVPAANVGDGSNIAGASGSGSYPVPVEVRGNGGNVTLTASQVTALTSGADTIPWSEIVGTGTGTIAVPDVGAGSVVLTATGRVVNMSDTWSFYFDNTTIYAEGSYNGQVLYTATLP